MCCDNCEGKCKNEQRISDLEVNLQVLSEQFENMLDVMIDVEVFKMIKEDNNE